MKIGTMLPTFCTGEQLVPASTLRRWSQRAEEAGFAGLWALDHLVKPPTYNSSMLDPIVALSHAGSVTSSILLGTSILILPLRRTANAVSRALSLQHLAGRRITLGLGLGYVPKEFEAAGVPMKERSPRFSEAVEVMNRLFSGEASFDGQFHDFEDVRIDPVLDPPPRMLAGGDSSVDDRGNRWLPDPILERILNTDGWIGPPSNPEKIGEEWTLIREGTRERGRDPEELDFVVLNYTHIVETDDREQAFREQRPVFERLFDPSRGFDHARKQCLVGTVDEIRDQLRRYEELGVDEVIVGPASSRPDQLRQQIELLSRHLLPAFEGG